MSEMSLKEDHSTNPEEGHENTRVCELDIDRRLHLRWEQLLTDNENDDFTILYSLDHELHTRATRALELVDSLDTQGAQNRVLDTMEGEELWLEEVRKKLETMGILGDECNEMLRVAMLEKVDQILAAIKSIGTTLASRTNEDSLLQDHASVTVETGW
ncbi:hypothetical protein BU15DRAFT_66832 [Melanogaster broomeanus]|nr:hypothetical protein BU15DRAFT_66832 [Melanogaster broomeanus]